MKNELLRDDEVESVPTAVGQPKVSRNEPCICGSGLKYKKCGLH